MNYAIKVMTTFLLLFFTALILLAGSYSFGVVSAKELEKTGKYIFDCSALWTEIQVEMAYSATEKPFMCEGSKRHQDFTAEMNSFYQELESHRAQRKEKETQQTPKFDLCGSNDVLVLIRHHYTEVRTTTQVLDENEFALRFKDNTKYQPISEASFTFALYSEERNADGSVTCFSQLEVLFVDPQGNSLVEKKSVGWKMLNADGYITLVDFKF